MRYYLKNSLFFFIFIFEVISLVFSFSVYSQVQHDLAVTATVLPGQSDFQFSFASTDGLTTVNQNTTLSYQITYGVNSSAGTSANTTIVADFSGDLAPDNSHVLDYVIGSATTAYGGAIPVVDLANRTITWTIPNLPAGTINQTVNFQLKTNSNYTGTNTVNFTTVAKMSNQYVTLPNQSVSQSYQFNSGSVNPAPTQSSPPNNSPTPTPPTITPSQAPPKITDVTFTNISDSQATVSVSTSPNTKLSLSYGTNPLSLSKTIKSNNLASNHSLTLDNLLPDTTYYFRIIATDKNGLSITSEIFTFKTAKKSDELTLNNAATNIVVGGITIYSRLINKNFTPGLVLLTDNTEYELNYILSNNIYLNSLEIIVKNKNQAGSQTATNISAYQKNPTLFVARLRTYGPQSYEVFVRGKDSNGNLVQLKVADLKVIPRISVYSKESLEPLGDARIQISYLNSKTGKYESLIKESFGEIKNPQFTNKNGKINMILPEGKYRAAISSFWHKEQIKDFVLGPKNDENFPVIYLEKDLFNIKSLINNLKNVFVDFFSGFKKTTESLSVSIRFFNILAFITTIFSFISLIFFLLRTHIKISHLPTFFLFHLHKMVNLHKDKYIFGVVVDNDNMPITKVLVELIDKKSGNITTHTLSNKSGHFQILNSSGNNYYELLVTKDGFKPIKINAEDMSDKGLKITLSSGGDGSQNTIKIASKSIEHIAGSLFESTLIISIILEFLFLYFFGFAITLPFFVLSFINIALWIFYLKEHNEYK